MKVKKKKMWLSAAFPFIYTVKRRCQNTIYVYINFFFYKHFDLIIFTKVWKANTNFCLQIFCLFIAYVQICLEVRVQLYIDLLALKSETICTIAKVNYTLLWYVWFGVCVYIYDFRLVTKTYYALNMYLCCSILPQATKQNQ